MKKGKKLVKVFSIVFLIIFNSNLYPCTTFISRVGTHLYFGRNLDWICGTGLIMTNQRNLKKVALVDSTEKPMKWISKYGSITFNQVGKELPYGGINEAGLVVEHMSLEKTVYSSKDDRGALEPCQWIQFQLDNYSTIEEVIKSDELVRIIDSPSKFHFLICDRFGHSAVIEFIDGKMIYYTGENLPYEALANSTYSESVDCINNSGRIQSDRSIYNFTTAAKMISKSDSTFDNTHIEYVFNVLNSVRQEPGTKWSIVYDITEMKFYIKVFETPTIIGEQKIFLKHPGDSKTKIIDIKQFSFECAKASRILDLEYDTDGLVNNNFIEYTTDLNKEYISKAFTFFKGWGIDISLNDEQIKYLSKYPESFMCAGN